MIPKRHNQIDNLPKISNIRYENIFRVYQDSKTGKDFYWYNITNKINLPSQIDESLIDSVLIDKKTPWTTVAYSIYGSIFLWYLLVMLNKTDNKFYVSAGETIKFIKPEYLQTIINNINE